MKRSKILVLVLTVSLLVGIVLAVTVPVGAMTYSSNGEELTESSWIAAPDKTLVKCTGTNCSHENCYAYSFAVVGDTQNLNYIDAQNYVAKSAADSTLTYENYTEAHMRTLYNWILANEESKNIQYVMGLGDITQSFKNTQTYYDEEWALAKEAISLLDGEMGYSLVRGNHDISSGLNGEFGAGSAYYNALVALSENTDAEGRPMAGLRDTAKIEDSYRKIIIGEGDSAHKYIIFTLEYYPTEQTVTWLNETLSANSDYDAIITLHSFLNRDSSFVDDFETTTPEEDATNSNWSQTATGGNVPPRTLWENSLSKHANVKLILSGHVDVEDIVVNQLRGEQGNTVTMMLIDGQTIDSAVEPVGLVAMFYVNADGDVMNVEYISTVRAAAGKNSYLKEKNQFEIDLDYGDDWVSTAYGNAPATMYNNNVFNIFLDDDSVADNDNFYFGGYNDWKSVLSDIHSWNGIGGVANGAKKTFNILMNDDYTFSSGLAPNATGKGCSKITLDINGKTLTLGDNGVFVPFYNQYNDRTPTLTVKNGNVVMAGSGNLVTFNNAGGESNRGSVINLNLESLDISYDGSTSSVIGYFTGNPYESYVNLNVTDCDFDLTAAGGDVTIFDLGKNTSNNNDVTMKIIGGSVVAESAEAFNFYTLNIGNDTASFVKNAEGNYTSVSLSSSSAPVGVFRNEEGKLLNFTTASTSAPYVFEAELAPVEETPHGLIPIDAYPKETYPFVLFQNGDIVAAYQNWYDFCQNIWSFDTKEQGVTVLYLRDSITVSKTSDQLRNVRYLTFDLGGNTLTAGAVLFNFEAELNYDFTTNITINNGTVTLAKAWAPLISYNSTNTEDVDCRFDLTFNGVTVNATSDFSGRMIAEAWKDGTYGTKNSITLNDCIFDAQIGNISKLFQLEEANSQNKVDVAININGGKLIANSYFTLATFSAERESGIGSPDTITFGRGTDGEEFYIQLPNSVTQPTVGIVTTVGTLYPIETVDDGTNSIYYFEDIVIPGCGTIKTDYLSAVDYPFIIFKNGTCHAAGTVWNGASSNTSGVIPSAISAASSASDVVTVIMRRDVEHSSTKTVNTYHNLKGTLNIDLMGNTITTNRELFQINQKNTANTLKINIKNGLIVITARRLGAFANQHASIRQDLELTFENVNFSYKSVDGSTHYVDMINQNAGSSSGDYSKNFCVANVTFDNCTVDLTGHTNSTKACTLITAGADSQYAPHAMHIVFKGGNIIIDDDHTWTLASRKTGYPEGEADTLKFIADENGNYTKFTMVSTVAVPSDTYDSIGISFAKVSDDGTTVIYQLGEDENTSYGCIPFKYADTEKYPFVLFKDGEVIHAFSNWKTFIEEGIVENTEYQSGCTLLLRCDFTTNQGNSQNLCYIDDIEIDLCGNKLIRGSSHLFQAYGKEKSDTGSETRITVKNGIMLTSSSNAPIAFNNASTVGARAKFDFIFENVTFGRTSGSTAKLISESFTSGAYGSDDTITLNNCTVSFINDDTVGSVAPSANVYLFDLNDGGKNNISVVINGGEVKLADASYFNIATADATGDSVTFSKSNNENYTVFTLPAGAEAPAVSINDGKLAFVKISENGETVTYRLRPTEVASIDFVPKMSLTLDRDLILNVYVPVKDFLESFVLDGKADTEYEVKIVTLDGEQYYHAAIALSAKEAARDVVLMATVNIGEKVATGTFTFGIIKYAEQVLADGSAVEKTLVCDVLSYIRAAYAYFNIDDAASVSRINVILGENYDSDNLPVMNGSATATTAGLSSVTFVLDATPTIRFYLASGADANAYKFYINGVLLNTVTGTKDGLTYIDLDTYAYAVCETVTYTINDTESGSFHINAYYEWAKTENDTELVTLVERFAKYCESAKAYRDSVVSE